jgi:hypothetical protein
MIAKRKIPVGTAEPYVKTAKKNQKHAKTPSVDVDSRLSALD